MGEMQIAIKFKSVRVAENFKANKGIWSKWFSKIEVLGDNTIRYERIAWVKITGVPFLAWDEANFATVAGIFDNVLVNTCSFWNNNDVCWIWCPRPQHIGMTL